jgi:acyl-CoA thioesterase
LGLSGLRRGKTDQPGPGALEVEGSRPVGDFEHDTAVTEDASGVYACAIGQDWWVGAGPNGGYLAAILVRALQARVDTGDRPLRSLTVHYLRAPQPGPARVEVQLEREGRSVTFARLVATQEGRQFASALAVLARDRDAVELATAEAPAIPAPDTIEPMASLEGVPPFAQHFDYRPLITPAEGQALTGGWFRLREDRPLDPPLVTAMCDSWFPAIFAVVHEPLGVPTLDLTVHLRARLPRPAEWVLGRFTTRTVADGFLEEDGELWSADGELLAQSRQLALAR